jgi:hypothetical protein
VVLVSNGNHHARVRDECYRVWLMKPSAAREIMLKGYLVACGIMVLTLIVTRPMNRRIVARYQRTIDQLDALEGDGG